MQQPTQQPAAKKALGEPIRWTDAAMNDLSSVTEADQQHALALWQNEAPPRFRELLQASVETTEADA